MSTNKETKVTIAKLQTILGKDWGVFEEKILSNCLCGECHGVVKIVDYDIFLNGLNDIIFKGKCAICNARVGRYVEIGKDEIFVKRVKKVRQEMKKRNNK